MTPQLPTTNQRPSTTPSAPVTARPSVTLQGNNQAGVTGNEACPATHPTVYQQCGCNPLHEAMFNLNAMYARHSETTSPWGVVEEGESSSEQMDTALVLFTTMYGQEATGRVAQWNACQQGAMGIVVPQAAGVTRPGLSSTSPLTIPVAQPVVPQKTIPVFDHPARYVLDEIKGAPLDFHRVYPDGREVHYSLTITGDLIKIEWPGVTDYFDVKRLRYDYATKSYPQALELADCTIRIQVLATGQKILEIAPKD